MYLKLQKSFISDTFAKIEILTSSWEELLHLLVPERSLRKESLFALKLLLGLRTFRDK